MTQHARALRSLRRAVAVADTRRALVDALALEAAAPSPGRPLAAAFEALARDGAERAPWGIDASLALVADLAAWAWRGDLAPPLAFAVAATVAGEAHAHRVARPVAMTAIDDGLSAARAHADLAGAREAEAEARVRRITRERGVDAVVREVFVPALERDLAALGDAAFFVSRAAALGRMFPELAEDAMGAAAVMLAVTWGCAHAGGGLEPVPFAPVELPAALDAPLDPVRRASLVRAVLEGGESALTVAREAIARGVAPRQVLFAAAEAVALRASSLPAGVSPSSPGSHVALARTLRKVHAALSLCADAADSDAVVMALQCVGAATRHGPWRATTSGASPRAMRFEEALEARDLDAARAAEAALADGDAASVFARMATFVACRAATRPYAIAAAVQSVEALRALAHDDPGAAPRYLDAALALTVPWRPERDLEGLVREVTAG